METPVPAAGPRLHHRKGDHEPGASRRSGASLQAVRRFLGSDTTFIWGPPGTGKTWTLARVVEAHYRAGRSVLLVSNTNVAVDAALEQVAERLRDEPGFVRGLVIRHGPVVSDSLRHRFGAQVTPEEVAARLRWEKWRREAQRPRQEAEAARAALKRLEANWVTWIISTYDRWRLQERIAGAERICGERRPGGPGRGPARAVRLVPPARRPRGGGGLRERAEAPASRTSRRARGAVRVEPARMGGPPVAV